ncbi:MAG TPA: ATP-binding cassette domain-containing protein [Methylomirabilota bacterium]|nr:ATP-binding cassette domain-containing protein [Methylomirabilota bacterium]
MIYVDKLTKFYGPIAAIQEVSFTIEKGEIIGFLGPNGAGKTTTMRILSCFMPASSGQARVAGLDCFTQSIEVRKRIGYLPENVPLYPEMPVAAYLDFVAELKGVGRSERRGRVAEVMERCMISDVQQRLIGKLSKGYRQRVGLAQALINEPEVLILDEPTIGLDPKQIIEIRQLIKSLAGQRTVILSTHILPEASMVCQGVIIINRGRIVASGGWDQLQNQVFPSRRIELQIDGPAGAVEEALGRIPGVSKVASAESAAGLAAFVVESPGERDVRGEIFQLAADRRWKLLEMHQIGTSLEEIFLKLVAGEETPTQDAAEQVP